MILIHNLMLNLMNLQISFIISESKDISQILKKLMKNGEKLKKRL